MGRRENRIIWGKGPQARPNAKIMMANPCDFWALWILTKEEDSHQHFAGSVQVPILYYYYQFQPQLSHLFHSALDTASNAAFLFIWHWIIEKANLFVSYISSYFKDPSSPVYLSLETLKLALNFRMKRIRLLLYNIKITYFPYQTVALSCILTAYFWLAKLWTLRRWWERENEVRKRDHMRKKGYFFSNMKPGVRVWESKSYKHSTTNQLQKRKRSFCFALWTRKKVKRASPHLYLHWLTSNLQLPPYSCALTHKSLCPSHV